MKRACLLLALSLSLTAAAQNRVDALHYRYELELSDRDDTLRGQAILTLRVQDPAGGFYIDLAGRRPGGKGMTATVTGLQPRDSFFYRQEKDRLHIIPSGKLRSDTLQVRIRYSGVPETGLIIGRNRFGQRTFFGDNWPNRAHHWIPCVDDPADKASVEFIVTAPAAYRVVANGECLEEMPLPGHLRRTHWREDQPLPTKVMVIGVADFAVRNTGKLNDCIPVSSWVYPPGAEAAFDDLAAGRDILAWMQDYIGPFAYKKLANVQSTTMFGGMENAGAIFYAEDRLTGKKEEDELVAHEIAHQWFGNMATEKSFAHLWLSEGFATYMTHVYMEARYGAAKLQERMRQDREEVLAFVKMRPRPVVDSTPNPMELLSPNSYQKGGWVLHMLRQELGDSIFHQVIRRYYAQYAGRNAGTDDFRQVAESVSGRKLEGFFRQWLHRPYNPDLLIEWSWLGQEKILELTVTQRQPEPFRLRLDLRTMGPDGLFSDHRLMLEKSREQLRIPLDRLPVKLEADPDTRLLFSAEIKRLR